MFIKDIYLCVFLTKCTGLPSHFLVGVWPDSYARRRAHCLVISGELISLQEQLHTYITSWLKQGLALLRPVNPSLQLRRPQRHAPTTTPLPLPKRRASLCRSQHHINYQTLRVHTWCMAVLPHPPSCSTNPHGGTAAIFFYYLSSRRLTSATTCFSLSNHVRFSSGTPS